jgi:hypothetical protein
MARQNPYQMDPFLAQGFSSLTKALIGDAETDYQVARTGYQDAQTNRLNTLLPFEQQTLEAQIAQRNAAANASNEQAGLYGSQTTEQDLLNTQLQNLTNALTTLSSSPEVQAQVSAATGIDFSNAANVDAVRSALVTAMLGGTGNVDQRSSAFTNMANQANTNTAFNQIMDPNATPDQIRQAFIASGGDPGKYFDAGAADTEINNDYSAALDKNTKDLQGTQYTADQNLEGNMYKADQALEGTRITAAATEAYQNFKSNLQFGEGGQGDRDKAQDVAQAQWEVNNKPLEFTVTPGQQIVLSPEAGMRIGLEPNDQGLYVLEGGAEPGKIVVKVGTDDVYLTEADAAALGIPKNENGQYMIPGRPTPKDPNNPDKNNYSVPPNVDATLQEQLNVLMDGNSLPIGLQLQIKRQAGASYSGEGSTPEALSKLNEAFGQIVTVDAPGLGNKTYTTTTTIDETKEVLAASGIPAARKMLTDLGYTADQAEEIIRMAGD